MARGVTPGFTPHPPAPIRTITLGVAEAHPIPAHVIEGAAAQVRRFEDAYREGGYEVQTVRLSTRSIFDDMADWAPDDVLAYTQELQQVLDRCMVTFCSVGPVRAATRPQSLRWTEILPDLLARASSLNATVQLAMPGHKPRIEVAEASAEVIRRLATVTEEGFGNFRFAALACVPPGAPFFPAAYHEGPASVSIGIQGAGIVRDALEGVVPFDLEAIMSGARDALAASAGAIVQIVEQLAREEGIRFGGIDLSPAPMGADSIVAAIEAASGERFGSPGTLAVVSALTAAIKSVDLSTCGYTGLMLPVLEDALLGERWKEGRVDTRDLLFYSAVCGTGLDTVPLPGDSSTGAIARLLLDVAGLATRLGKPLSARLFPVPGTHAGDMTSFSSPYLTDTVVKW